MSSFFNSTTMDNFAKNVEAQAKNIEMRARNLGARVEEIGQIIGERAEEIGQRVRTNQENKSFSLNEVFQWVKDTFGTNTDMIYNCAKKNDVQMMLQILDNSKPDIRPKLLEYKDARGRTPLMMACSHGHVLSVQVLLEQGAFIDATDMKGNTPFHYACQEGAAGVVEYLTLLAGVSPYILNTRGLSPIELARKAVENKVVNAGKCVQLLETRTQVYQGWLYESVDNLGSAVLGLSALQSWAKRYVIVLRIGSPLYLEMAFFDVINGQRSPLPTSTLMLHVPSQVSLNTKVKVFDSKPFAFTVRGAKKKGGGIVGSLETRELAATDLASFHSWATFLVSGGAANSLMDPLLITPTGGAPGPQSQPPSQPTAPQMPPVPFNVLPEVHSPPQAAKELPNDFVYAPPVSISQLHPPTPASAPPLVTDVPLTDTATTQERVVDDASMPGECVVCFDGPQNAVCVPCGHAAVCMKCADHIKQTSKQCAVCRADVREVIQLYHV